MSAMRAHRNTPPSAMTEEPLVQRARRLARTFPPNDRHRVCLEMCALEIERRLLEDEMQFRNEAERQPAQAADVTFGIPHIRTDFIYPPIPIRTMDWQAIYADDEPNDDGQMASGHGRTETAAIADLIENHPRED